MGKKKVRVVILALIPVFIFVLLAMRAFQNSAAYYYTISEANELRGQEQKLRIKGQVLMESINYDPTVPLLEFSLVDQGSQLDVTYGGVLPDNFHHADEVIVEGKFNSQGQFVVAKLMLQCPSKYEGEE